MGAEQIQLPIVELVVCLAEGGVQTFCFGLFQQTFPVGGIGDDHTAVGDQIKLSSVGNRELDHVRNPCALCVFSGHGYSLGVDVGCEDAVFTAEFSCLGFFNGLVPDFAVEVGPAHCGKLTVDAGGAVLCSQCCFDGDGAAAAEGIGKVAAAAIACNVNHGSCQSFTQRCSHVCGTVAALKQACACGVQVQHCGVVHNGKLNLVQGTVFGQPGDTIAVGHTGCHSLLDDALAVGNGVQLAVQTVTLYGELAVPGDKGFPADGLGAFKQFIKGTSGEAAHYDQYAFTEAGTDVGACHTVFIAAEVNAAVFGADVFHAHVAQFIAYKAFQTKQAGDTKFQFQINSPFVWETRVV